MPLPYARNLVPRPNPYWIVSPSQMWRQEKRLPSAREVLKTPAPYLLPQDQQGGGTNSTSGKVQQLPGRGLQCMQHYQRKARCFGNPSYPRVPTTFLNPLTWKVTGALRSWKRLSLASRILDRNYASELGTSGTQLGQRRDCSMQR